MTRILLPYENCPVSGQDLSIKWCIRNNISFSRYTDALIKEFKADISRMTKKRKTGLESYLTTLIPKTIPSCKCSYHYAFANLFTIFKITANSRFVNLLSYVA